MKIFIYLRRFSLCVLLGLSLSLNAQNVSHNFKNTINNVFAGVDLDKVPHDLLLDYAMEFVDVRSYKGVANDTNYVHKGIYTSGFNTLLMARTKTNVTDLVNPNQFENNWNAERTPYTIALSGLYYKYSRIRENAHPNAIRVSRNKLYDKYDKGVWQNPYETGDVFMMTAPILFYKYKNMEVKLPANLWYSNQSTNVQSIAVDFNNGNGYQTLTMGQSVNVSYANAGTYDWDYKITIAGGQTLYSHSKLIVGDQTAPIGGSIKRLPNEPCTTGNLVNGFDQIEFQGTQLFEGFANSATIQIDYIGNTSCGNITNPLIVAEGFESGLLGNENTLGDNDIENFIDEATDMTGNLGAEIAKYDIIYINWDQGRDDLRRNALLLEDIIEWVNDTKTSTTQNIVLGQSMGGIIARYALADMEQNPNLDHDTSLYISHDAPHQGANIPLGIQFLARHLADQFVSTPLGDIDLPAAGGGSVTISDIQNVFNSPGTRQLLSNTINGSFNLENGAFDTWQAELQALGYPTQTRNIAISNGSHCANFQELGIQQELLFLSGDIEPTILLDTIINYFPLVQFGENFVYVALAIILEDPAYLAGLLPGRTNLNARFEAKTLPNIGQTANIYKGRMRITKKIDFLLFTLTYNINITDREYNNPIEVQLPFDSYPGGFYPVSFDLSEINEEETNNWLYNLNLTGRSANSFNFISTPTALDVGRGNTTLNNSDYLTRYNASNPPIGSKAIPFDNFTTSLNNGSSNEAHISFNTRNGDWLAAELDATTSNYNFDCTFICDDDGAISGPGLLCNTATYSINSPAITNIDWTITPANAGTLNEISTTEVQVTVSNGYNGPVTLNASVDTNRCGDNISLNKTIHFGVPTGIATISGDDDLYPGITDSAYFLVNTSNISGGSTVSWSVYSGSNQYASLYFSLNTYNYQNSVVVVADDNTPEGNYYIQARISNACGYKSVSKIFYVNEAGDPQFYPRMANNYSLYPNPSKVLVNIALVTNEKQQVDKEVKVSGELFDVLGRSKIKVDMQHNGAQFNVSRLNPGVYVLKIYLGETIETHQVLVK